MLRMIAAGQLSGRMAKPVVAALAGGDGASLAAVVERECGGAMVTDESELRALCETVVREMTEQVVAYRAGKTRLMGLFVGQVRETLLSCDGRRVGGNPVHTRLAYTHFELSWSSGWRQPQHHLTVAASC